ncbi:MAG: hypothetical protein E7660_01180 [Ruminococcaceae bacterium]|nr:hypothetical protein [Oscillospiraceae bacterium]
MKAKKILSLILLLSFALPCLSGCSLKKNPSAVYDRNGNVMGYVTSLEEGVCETENEEYIPYIDIVKKEAVETLSLNGYTEEEAEKALLSEGFDISTCFDPSVFSALKAAAESSLIENSNAALAAVDNSGWLTAVYSKSIYTDEYVNFATEKTKPYSAIKPLSVYAPAIDAGLMTWSTVFEDSPVKKVTDADGTERNWPSNASGTYAMENVTVQTAIKKSLNTVAVKALLEYGVSNSLSFLEGKLGFDVSFEKQTAAAFGEDEILSALALGYLSTGVSPVDMAGCYQIFATGGKYYKPETITEISSVGILTLSYFAEYTDGVQVIEPSTADIMNRLLQTVTEEGGTGKDGALGKVPVAAKTGTGENFEGSWFVGSTPDFTLSVWHDGTNKNYASEIFRSAASPLVTDESKTEFPACDEVIKGAFCPETGLLLGENCRIMEIGYFWKRQMPDKCNGH